MRAKDFDDEALETVLVLARVPEGELCRPDATSVRTQRAQDFIADLGEKVGLAADRHGLHVDQDRNEVRAEPSVRDLEEDGCLAASTFTAEHEQLAAALGILAALAHQF